MSQSVRVINDQARRDLVDRIIRILNRDFNDAGSYRQNKQTTEDILAEVERAGMLDVAPAQTEP
jgi:type IV secretory pathway VirB4 component